MQIALNERVLFDTHENRTIKYATDTAAHTASVLLLVLQQHWTTGFKYQSQSWFKYIYFLLALGQTHLVNFHSKCFIVMSKVYWPGYCAERSLLFLVVFFFIGSYLCVFNYLQLIKLNSYSFRECYQPTQFFHQSN